MIAYFSFKNVLRVIMPITEVSATMTIRVQSTVAFGNAWTTLWRKNVQLNAVANLGVILV